MKYDPVTVAEMFLYVRESQSQGQNRGARVEAMQHWALGNFGDPWCDEFDIGFILDICFQGDGPFPYRQDINASTVSALAYAKTRGWVTDKPVRGDLVFSVDSNGVPHHVAFFVEEDPDDDTIIATIAGNTSEDGTSSNGDRVAQHAVTTTDKVFVHYPRTPQEA